MIELKYLKLVQAVDAHGSLSKAAAELHLTQSALSHQLKNLESQLELTIFHRANGQLIFTESGRILLEQSANILQAHIELEKRMISYKQKKSKRYVHGYSEREAQRLADQANSISDYLHYDSIWPSESRILEVGCGVGAQTSIIAQNNPDCFFDAIDISTSSLSMAEKKIRSLGIENVNFLQQDAFHLNPDHVRYDGIFICFLLEHVSQPLRLLRQLKPLINPGGSITIIEGDHGSTFFYPENIDARKVIQAQIDLQAQDGGNANIGRELHSLMQQSDYKDIKVTPRVIYVDDSKPQMKESFIKNTFTAMIQGIEENVVARKIIDKDTFKKGIEGLLRTKEKNGMFNYSFFKATAVT